MRCWLFSNRKEAWLYAVVEFLPSHPQALYASMTVSQNYGNMMLRIQVSNTSLEQVQTAIEEYVWV